jgi:hypothetical protein
MGTSRGLRVPKPACQLEFRFRPVPFEGRGQESHCELVKPCPYFELMRACSSNVAVAISMLPMVVTLTT